MHWKTVLTFWFKQTKPEQRFAKRKKFDAVIRRKFLKTYMQIVRGEKAEWRANACGRLAEIVVLDQFARNMFRDTPSMFAHDALALALAQEAIRAGADKKLTREERMFLYMPFMHSESRVIHRESLKLFKGLGNKEALWYARDHKKIIDRFGRYPHRNKVLGRKITAVEKKFLKTHKGY